MSDFSPGYRGGVFEGLEAPTAPDWWSEDAWAADDWIALHATWAPYEAMAEADPPPAPPGLDLGQRGGSGGSGEGGDRQTETLRGRVQRISSDGGGLILVGTGTEADDSWVNASRYARPPVDFSGLRVGQAIEVVVTRAKTGRVYVEALRPLSPSWPAESGG